MDGLGTCGVLICMFRRMPAFLFVLIFADLQSILSKYTRFSIPSLSTLPYKSCYVLTISVQLKCKIMYQDETTTQMCGYFVSSTSKEFSPISKIIASSFIANQMFGE